MLYAAQLGYLIFPPKRIWTSEPLKNAHYCSKDCAYYNFRKYEEIKYFLLSKDAVN